MTEIDIQTIATMQGSGTLYEVRRLLLPNRKQRFALYVLSGPTSRLLKLHTVPDAAGTATYAAFVADMTKHVFEEIANETA